MITSYRTITFFIAICFGFREPGGCQGIINGGFESWKDDGKPVGWTTGPARIGLRQTNDAHSGKYAAEIYTWYSGNLGSLVNGESPDAAGDPYINFRNGGSRLFIAPQRLTGYYKLTNDGRPGESNVFIMVLLKKFNGKKGKIDTVQLIKHKLEPADNYMFFQIPFNYPPGNPPDSVLIGFFSHGVCADSSTCLYLKVDDVQLNTKETNQKHGGMIAGHVPERPDSPSLPESTASRPVKIGVFALADHYWWIRAL